VSITLLAFSCGKSGSASDRDGSGGKATGGTTAAGHAGASASGGTAASGGRGGDVTGESGRSAGGEQSGAGESSNASRGGTGNEQAGGSNDAAGAGGTTDSTAGHAGSDDAVGTSGAAGAGSGNDLTLFLMFDRSWSMNECGDGTETPVINNSLECQTAPSRWSLASSALTQFVEDPAAAGLSVALRFFPDDRPAVGCDGYYPGFPDADGGFPAFDAGSPTPPSANCDIDACSKPLVDAAPLSAASAPSDAQEATLVAAIQASPPPGPEMPNPNPATPTSAALAGAEQWAVAYRQAHPDEPTAVVLITDGEPQGCDTNTENIAKLASDAKATAGVLTYVIGLAASTQVTTSANQIAAAGGTKTAFLISDGSTAVHDLFAALSAIREGRR
jgi:hypothetical protein